MNDNDIIKALECCAVSNCDDCPYFKFGNCVDKLEHDALDLINRQKAEIERLTKENEQTIEKWHILEKRTKERYAELYEEAKEVVRAEAVKEFAEKIKGIDLYQCIEEYYKNAELCYDVRQDWFCEYIDKLVKEMTEGDKS